ncbi:hypothetical protein [Salinicoccus roseus]|uniref:hypothetical protein n=1 Tax=Salinicoccus roseus TaxID=45670 RepID=UPI002300682D|nr:hypothetical protein [Salinicoccus roseus]
MIIEFSAIPGAGKTYLSELLCSYLKTELSEYNFVFITRKDLQEMRKEKFKNKIIRRIYILYNILDYRIISLIFTLLRGNGSFENKINKIIFFVNNVLNYKFLTQLYKQGNSNHVFLLDEGLLHASEVFIDINNQLPENMDVSKYFDRITSLKSINYSQTEKMYIFIDSNIKENFNRISKREQGWPDTFKNLSESNKLEELDRFKQRYTYIKEFIDEGPEKNLVIDNSIFQDNYNIYFDEIKKYILKKCIF